MKNPVKLARTICVREQIYGGCQGQDPGAHLYINLPNCHNSVYSPTPPSLLVQSHPKACRLLYFRYLMVLVWLFVIKKLTIRSRFYHLKVILKTVFLSPYSSFIIGIKSTKVGMTLQDLI
jgi:hypothetical protein